MSDKDFGSLTIIRVDVFRSRYIPDLYCARGANSNVFLIGRPGNIMRHTTMIAIVSDVTRRISIPYLYITITSNGNALTIRRPGHAIPGRRNASANVLSPKSENMLASHSKPLLHSTIIASGSNTAAIRRPGYIKYGVCMTTVGHNAFARNSIPDLHSRIETARRQVFAIRRPGHCKGIAIMTSIGVDMSTTMSIPHLHSAITTGGSNTFAIRGPAYTAYIVRVTLIRIMNWRRQVVLHKGDSTRKVNIRSRNSQRYQYDNENENRPSRWATKQTPLFFFYHRFETSYPISLFSTIVSRPLFIFLYHRFETSFHFSRFTHFLEKTNEGRQLHYDIKREAFTLQIDGNVQ